MAELDTSLDELALLLFNSRLCLVVESKNTWTHMEPEQSRSEMPHEIQLKVRGLQFRGGREPLPSVDDDRPGGCSLIWAKS